MEPRRARVPDMRLVVITDGVLAAPRSTIAVVQAALDAGAPAVQLRDKRATARELVEQARALLGPVRAAGALLFVNDRLDVALAAGAHGVHLGPHDLPVAAARRLVPEPFLIGYSTDDPAAARRAQADGASYIGCGAVFGTATKSDLGCERIGVDRLDAVARAVTVPVVAIGGITPANIAQIAATRAAGAAAAGAIMAADDPAAATRQLLAAFEPRTNG
jgi:thiamine-phosphate pyrophosphorylase